jgi:hypothetical protein
VSAGKTASVRRPYLTHRLLVYHTPAVRMAVRPYGAMGMVQLTGAVIKIRKGS